MRHRIGGRQLGRNSGQRKALYRGQLISLLTHGRICTTEAKAKAAPDGRARDHDWARGRLARQPQPRHVGAGEQGGGGPAVCRHWLHFADPAATRIFKLGVRVGDGATVCQIELIDL